MTQLAPEIAGKLRQFKRLIMSYGDFQHARLTAEYILEEKLHERCSTEGYVALEAFNCSMIIAYCRPFSGNDSGLLSKVPDLPSRFLLVLNREERGIHDVVLTDRNKLLAHSDARRAIGHNQLVGSLTSGGSTSF